MPHEQTAITTQDGTCPTYIFTPATTPAPWPAIIFYMDALAIRPAIFTMAQRLADAGYLVALPDLFYRYGPYPPFDPKQVFAGDFRTIIGPLMSTTDNHKAARDTAALLAYLDTRTDIAGPKIGTIGFCMGGGMAITAAGTFPDRVAAVASFHGGSLATDAPTSPHLLAPKIKAELYIAGADHDDSYPPEMAARLETALTESQITHRMEIYKDASHGWMKPDFPIYDEAAAERGWKELLALFARALH